jgi:hypothetical protein
MSNKIQTYDDLLKEKEQMEQLLKAQGQLIKRDIAALKEEFRPAAKAVSALGKIATRDHTNPLLDNTANTIIDLVFRKFLLARTGWVTKLVVPFLLKNISSHAIANNKGSIASKLFSLLPSFGKNGHKKDKHADNPS